MHATKPKAKEIAGQQEIDRLSTPIGPKNEPPRGTRYDPVPALNRTLLWIDLLVPLIPGSDSERLQRLAYRSMTRGTLMRPCRLTDMQTSSIAVHFGPSIRLPCQPLQ
jgi:hypothetical protein